nr:hypothetical protein [uncultured Halomonas sp.]
MKLSDLCTPKGRRATGKLSLDLLKITGKVAVAGTATLVGALAVAVAKRESDAKEIDQFHDSWVIDDGFHAAGPEGPGYYENGFKMGE